MKTDSVNVNFGAKTKFKDAQTIVSIAKTATPQQYHGVLKTQPDLVLIGADNLIEHSIEYKKQKDGSLKDKVFRLITSSKKHPKDDAPSYVFKSKFLSVEELKGKAQDFLKAAEVAFKNNLSQKEIDKVGAEHLEKYAQLKSSQKL